jgi:GTPase
LLTDTVGFIQKLPTNLVAAFRATLEEVRHADVLVHVIDIANPVWEKQEMAVLSVLEDLGVSDTPIVRVLNKVDLLEPEDAEGILIEAATTRNSVVTSATLGEGLTDFVAVVEEAMAALLVSIEVVVPYAASKELNALHQQGNVEVVDYLAEGTYVKALVPADVANRLAKYSVQNRVQQESHHVKPDVWQAIGRGRHEQPNKI